MQKIATRIFIAASLLFGILGISIVLTMRGEDPPEWLAKTFFVTVFVILSSFAVSVAGKYLGGGK